MHCTCTCIMFTFSLLARSKSPSSMILWSGRSRESVGATPSLIETTGKVGETVYEHIQNSNMYMYYHVYCTCIIMYIIHDNTCTYCCSVCVHIQCTCTIQNEYVHVRTCNVHCMYIYTCTYTVHYMYIHVCTCIIMLYVHVHV